MKHKILFLIIFLPLSIKSSFNEHIFSTLPLEVIHYLICKLTQDQQYYTKKNLLMICNLFHKKVLELVLYEQNNEIKKTKTTNLFISNNRLMLLFLNEVLEQHNIAKKNNIISYSVSCSLEENKNIYVSKENTLLLKEDNEKEIDFFQWIGTYFAHLIAKDDEDKICEHSFSFDKIKLPYIKKLIIDLTKHSKSLKYLYLHHFKLSQKIEIWPPYNTISTISFPPFVDEIVIKKSVKYLTFFPPSFEDEKYLEENTRNKSYSQEQYDSDCNMVNHFYLKKLDLIVDYKTNESETKDNDYWFNVLRKLPLQELKLTFSSSTLDYESFNFFEKTNIFNDNLKKLTVKNCNRTIHLPQKLEELYITRSDRYFQLYGSNVLNIASFKQSNIIKVQLDKIVTRHNIIKSCSWDTLETIPSEVLEKITIQDCPTLKIVLVKGCKNVKKEHCICDNPKTQWKFEN